LRPEGAAQNTHDQFLSIINNCSVIFWRSPFSPLYQIKRIMKTINTLYHHLNKILGPSVDGFVSSSINTGFTNIDQQLNGLQLGELYVLGGAAAMGTKTMAKELALRVANHSGVLFLPQVESLDELTKKLLCIEGDIQLCSIEKQPWDTKLSSKVSKTMKAFKQKKFYLKNVWQYTEDDFFQLLEDYITQSDVKLIIIDHEERLFKNLKGSYSAEEKYLFVLKLKLLLNRLNCCGILLKKMNAPKPTEENPYQIPSLEDIQSEYDITRLANHLWIMHRLDYYGIEEDEVNNDTKNRIDLFVMDEDEGYLDNLYFKFNERFTGFEVMEELRKTK